MSKMSRKVIAIALLLYAGSFLAFYIGSIPPPPSSINVYLITEVNAPPDWTMWTYLSCTMFVFAVGFTIAAIKLRNMTS
jgi:hypothetical protein